MTVVPCPRRDEVEDAVCRRRWPDRALEHLLAHAAACDSCSEGARMATLRRVDADAVRDVRLPAAGQVWWRGAVRARLESARAAARPITWAQAGAAACAAGAAAAMATIGWPSLVDKVARMAGLFSGLDERSAAVAGSMVAALAYSLPLVVSVAALLVLTPVVVLYVALSDD